MKTHLCVDGKHVFHLQLQDLELKNSYSNSNKLLTVNSWIALNNKKKSNGYMVSQSQVNT